MLARLLPLLLWLAPADDLANDLAAARALLDQGQYEYAQTKLDALVGAHPADIQVALLQARLHRTLARYDQALAILEPLLQHEAVPAPDQAVPAPIEALELAAAIALETGRLEVAEARLKRIQERAPEHLSARLDLAQVLALRGRPEARALRQGVVEAYQAARDADAALYLVTGRACLALGRLDDARNMAHWAREKDRARKLPGIDLLSAQTELAAGRLPQAEAALEPLLLANPLHPEALLLAIEILLSQPETDQAAREKLADLQERMADTAPAHPGLALLQAREAQRRNAPEAARATLDAALEHYPTHPELLARRIALGYPDETSRAQAVAQLEQAASPEWAKERLKALSPDQGKGDLGLAQAALAAGDHTQAAELAERALNAEPGREALETLAAARRLSGTLTKLKLAVQKHLEAHPTDAYAWRIMGEVQAESGQRREALTSLQKAIELAPTDRLARVALGETQLALGDRAAATPILEALLNTPDESRETVLAAARASLALADAVQASRLLVRLAQQRDLEAQALLGRLYLDKLHFQEAQDSFNDLLKHSPRHPDALVGLAGVQLYAYHLGEERFLRAGELLERALGSNPSHVQAHVLLASLSAEADRPKEAAAHLEKALASDPGCLEALAMGAIIEPARRDELEARARAVTPRPSPFYLALAEHAENHFDYAGAVELARKAVDLDPAYWDAYHCLGLNLSRLAQEKEALRVLDRVYAVDTFNTWTNNLRIVLKRIRREYRTGETEHFTIRIHEEHYAGLFPQVAALCEEAYRELGARLEVYPEEKTLVEVLKTHEDFSARTIGMPFIGALGACFGRLVTIDGPTNHPKGEYNWAQTLWHEYAHVLSLQRSKHRVPRWYTEGLSVWAETRGRKHWVRDMEQEFLDALSQGRIPPLAELNGTFTRPRYPHQVLMSYFQGSLIADFLEQEFGSAALGKLLDVFAQGLGTEEAVRRTTGLEPAAFDERFLAFCRRRSEPWSYLPPPDPTKLEEVQARTEGTPQDPAAWTELAQVQLARGSAVDAEIAARRALELSPQHGDAALVMGLIALGQKLTANAAEHFQAALAGGTRDKYRAHLLAGLALVELQRGAEALPHLQAARELFPVAPAPYRPLAKLLSEQGRRAEARKIMEAYADIDPKEIKARELLVKEHLVAGEHEGAAARLAELLEIVPLNPELHQQRAQALRQLGRAEEALACFENALALGAKDIEGLRCDRAECLMDMGRLAEAAHELDAASQAAPKSRRVEKLRQQLEQMQSPTPETKPKEERKDA